jgi:hypothetical protein
MYENRIMKPVEIALKEVGGQIKEKDGGGKSKIYYKHLHKCHNVSTVQL